MVLFSPNKRSVVSQEQDCRIVAQNTKTPQQGLLYKVDRSLQKFTRL
jgi:hypothetical protein